jgi:hypothetical protein
MQAAKSNMAWEVTARTNGELATIVGNRSDLLREAGMVKVFWLGVGVVTCVGNKYSAG